MSRTLLKLEVVTRELSCCLVEFSEGVNVEGSELAPALSVCRSRRDAA